MNGTKNKKKRNRLRQGKSRAKKAKAEIDFAEFLKDLDDQKALPDAITDSRIKEIAESGNCFDELVKVCAVCGMFPKPGVACNKISAETFSSLASTLKRRNVCDELLAEQHSFPSIENLDVRVSEALSNIWVSPLGIDTQSGKQYLKF